MCAVHNCPRIYYLMVCWGKDCKGKSWGGVNPIPPTAIPTLYSIDCHTGDH